MAAGPLLTYALGATSSIVIGVLGISVAQFGLLASLTFLTAAALSLSLGQFTDRFHTRGLLVVVFAGAGLSFVVAALSRNYIWLLAAMFLSGAVQALSNPITNRVISQHVAPTKRSAWIGVKQSGVQVSQLIAGIGCPAIALLWGWRSALWLGAALTFALALLAWRCAPDSSAAHQSADVPKATNAPHIALPLPKTVWIFSGYGFLSGASLQATNVYLPLFAHRDMGLSLAASGLTAAFAGAVGLVARIGWGRALGKRWHTYTLLLILASGSTVGACVLLLATLLEAPPLLWAGVALHGATALAANVLLMAGALQVVDIAAVGRASSTIAVGMYLGFACGPAAFGLVLALPGGAALGWATSAAIYMACCCLVGCGRRSARRRSATKVDVATR